MADSFFKIRNGLTLGSLATDPTDGMNGDTYYNTTSNTVREYVNDGWHDAVQTDTTQTLTNKTISGNIAANLVNSAGTIDFNSSGTITVPNATDTLVGRATTDALSHKSIAYSVSNDSTAGSDATLAAFTTGIIRLTAPTTLASVAGIPAGTLGQSVIVENQTGSTISINNQDPAASAANRIYTGTGGNISMPVNSTYIFTYDVIVGSWMLTGGSGSGSGGGTKNYLTAITTSQSSTPNIGNGNFELGSTTGWSLFNTTITAGIPTGTINAGAPSVTTFAVTSTNTLAGGFSLDTASSGAWAAGAGFITAPFYIDNEDKNQVLSFRAAYSVISGATNLAMNGTSTNTFAFYIYDVTNSAWIQPSGVYSMSQTAGYAIGAFQATANSTQYRLAVIAVNASSGPADINWDDFTVGPQTLNAGIIRGPVGSIIATGSVTPPTGYLYANGSAVSRTTYGDLFRAIGTTYGAGDGSTTFNIPNLEGVFLRGAGSQTIGGIAYTGTLGASQTDQMQGHVHDFYGPSPSNAVSGSNNNFINNVAAVNTPTSDPVSDGTNGTPRIGAETRPANVSVAYHICYDQGNVQMSSDVVWADDVGSVQAFARLSTNVPSGYLFCDGSAVSRITYSALFAAIGTIYGVGDGSTTFNVPNLQGVFLRGSGSQTIGGLTYTGILGASQNDATKKNGLTISDPGHDHTLVSPSNTGSGPYANFGFNDSSTAPVQVTGTSLTGVTLGAGDSETRPANVAVNYFIKYVRTASPILATTGGGASSFVVPTKQVFSSGSGTYTTPTSPTPLYIKVKMVGAGGGGAGGGGGGTNGVTGGNTVFATNTANGGGGATFLVGGTGGSAGTITTGTGDSFAGQIGAYAAPAPGQVGYNIPGASGASSGFLAGSGGTPISTGIGGAGVFGGGGAGGGFTNSSSNFCGAGGGAGNYMEFTVSTPSPTYSYSIGTGGTNGTGGTGGGFAGGPGGDGIIEVTEYYQ